MQKTQPGKGKPRMPCNGPPPVECTIPDIKYLGDWLDHNGQCSFCENTRHKKAGCRTWARSQKLAAEHLQRTAANLPWPLTPEELKHLLDADQSKSTN
jgi:hypothetical protein